MGELFVMNYISIQISLWFLLELQLQFGLIWRKKAGIFISLPFQKDSDYSSEKFSTIQPFIYSFVVFFLNTYWHFFSLTLWSYVDICFPHWIVNSLVADRISFYLFPPQCLAQSTQCILNT
jgi:hypothetical protein